ncbi:unnamed protein product [Rotaria sordida]|uniref:RING-type domain-containing protein n=1 Tax=Rotaria sordida TaxID=392033 RepID=A0A818ZAT2_9BILA|nr:unnamed protein product [Rotaria sordida]
MITFDSPTVFKWKKFDIVKLFVAINDKENDYREKREHTYSQVLETCRDLLKRPGIHSVISMKAAGFTYTNVGDTVRCDQCKLEVSNWTATMSPFGIHAERCPNCSFVRAMQPSKDSVLFPSTFSQLMESSNEKEKSSIWQKTEENPRERNTFGTLKEVDILKQVRYRTFSHWSHSHAPSQVQMIEAGFFSCNIGDRVICLYCNLICQQWTSNIDNPYEVHKILSPKCPFVKAMLLHRDESSILIINESSLRNNSQTVNSHLFHLNEIVHTTACHADYIEIPKRHASFLSWPKENVPSVDDLVRAGFFYTGKKTIVTCFYCNGSLQNWGSNDNPTIEHARWFPQCKYAKQLCGDKLYRKIQQSKYIQQERSRETNLVNNSNSNNQKVEKQDDSTLSRLVAARLDLSISQRLIDKNFKLSIIKRCWEDQFRFKRDDFLTDCDLLIACLILQKQIEHISGNKDNIIVPSIQMKKIRQREYQEVQPALSSLSSDPSNNPTINITSSTQSTTNESNSIIAVETNKTEMTKSENTRSMNTLFELMQTTNCSLKNPCALCMSEERQLACIPCGHMATCVPCGHSLRLCPICRQPIDAFIRIYS